MLVSNALELSPVSFCTISFPIWYALFTEKIPDEETPQINLLDETLELMGMLQIFSTFASLEISQIRGTFHHPVSGSIISLTCAFLSNPRTSDCKTPEGLVVSHLSSQILIFEPSPTHHTSPVSNKAFALPNTLSCLAPNYDFKNVVQGYYFSLKICAIKEPGCWINRHSCLAKRALLKYSKS